MWQELRLAPRPGERCVGSDGASGSSDDAPKADDIVSCSRCRWKDVRTRLLVNSRMLLPTALFLATQPQTGVHTDAAGAIKRARIDGLRVDCEPSDHSLCEYECSPYRPVKLTWRSRGLGQRQLDGAVTSSDAWSRDKAFATRFHYVAAVEVERCQQSLNAVCAMGMGDGLGGYPGYF